MARHKYWKTGGKIGKKKSGQVKFINCMMCFEFCLLLEHLADLLPRFSPVCGEYIDQLKGNIFFELSKSPGEFMEASM